MIEGISFVNHASLIISAAFLAFCINEKAANSFHKKDGISRIVSTSK